MYREELRFGLSVGRESLCACMCTMVSYGVFSSSVLLLMLFFLSSRFGGNTFVAELCVCERKEEGRDIMLGLYAIPHSQLHDPIVM